MKILSTRHFIEGLIARQKVVFFGFLILSS